MAKPPKTEPTSPPPYKVEGYTEQSSSAVETVNRNKVLEEQVLRLLDQLAARKPGAIDQRWLAIGRTKIEEAFMAINRAVFQPQRTTLPEDGTDANLTLDDLT